MQQNKSSINYSELLLMHMSRTQNPTHAHNAYTYTHVHGDRDIPPRKIPPGRLYPGRLPPEHSPPSKPGFAKYAVDANLFQLESSILTRAKRATDRNNVGGELFLREYTGVERSRGQYT